MKEEGVAQPVPFDCVDEIDKTNATVVFQGVEGAYSHAASMAYFGDLATYFHVPNFEEVMKARAIVHPEIEKRSFVLFTLHRLASLIR